MTGPSHNDDDVDADVIRSLSNALNYDLIQQVGESLLDFSRDSGVISL